MVQEGPRSIPCQAWVQGPLAVSAIPHKASRQHLLPASSHPQPLFVFLPEHSPPTQAGIQGWCSGDTHPPHVDVCNLGVGGVGPSCALRRDCKVGGVCVPSRPGCSVPFCPQLHLFPFVLWRSHNDVVNLEQGRPQATVRCPW